jgi:hypothetical protein
MLYPTDEKTHRRWDATREIREVFETSRLESDHLQISRASKNL